MISILGKNFIFLYSTSFIVALVSPGLLFLDKKNNYKFILLWAFMNSFFSLAIGWRVSFEVSKIKDLPLYANDLINSKIKFYNSNNSKLKVITYISGVPLFVT